MFLICVFILGSCKSNNTAEFSDGILGYQAVNNVPLVKGTLNGKLAYFIIDSGSSLSMLDEKQIEEYEFTIVVDVSNNQVAGIGGMLSAPHTVSDAKVTIGGIEVVADFKAQDLQAMTRSIKTHAGFDVVGIVGSDWLANNNLVINYARKTISFSGLE